LKPFTNIFYHNFFKAGLFFSLILLLSLSAIAQSENAVTEGLDMKDPPNVVRTVEYNIQTGLYEIHHRIGDIDYLPVQYMTMDEYMKFDSDRALHEYWQSKTVGGAQQGGGDGIIPSIYIGNPLFNRVFGGSSIDVRLQGSVELLFGARHNYRADPMITRRQQRVTNFVFEEKINVNVVAKVGEKIEFRATYNTELTFGFENQLQLKYEGEEDDIIQLIEAGNVNLPLNSTLIKGNQSLFGVKTKLKFGKTTVTAVVSQQNSETQTVQMEGGGQKTEFSLKADDYEENRHFFLAQYFYDQYDVALADLPLVTSNININRVEVWITNIGPATQENRNIVAFMDMGEKNPHNNRLKGVFDDKYPRNESNNLMQLLEPNMSQMRNINMVTTVLSSPTFNMVSGKDYEKIESARKLQTTEYTFNPSLGFISLNTTLNANQTLAVAFEYTIIGDVTETVYQVGEFSDGGIPSTQTLMVKLLRSTAVDPRLPIWKLMMKNVYSLNAYQINSEDFVLNILFSGSKNGVPTGYLPEPDNTPYGSKSLIEVLGFDRMDAHQDSRPDGFFDFIDNAATMGGTIQSNNGRIYFTVKEPFGAYLRNLIGDKKVADKYCYDSLYTMTKTSAQQYPEKNKFLMQGYYKSSHGSEISLNGLNIPQGSVVVSAGGRQLVENVDYIVDYTLGVVRIINEGILNSGTPINVSSESRDDGALSSTKRTFLGVHVDHQVNRDLVLGATFLNMFERKMTQKTNLGDEPVNNVMWGLNADWQTESNMITKWINALPVYSSKIPSRVTLGGEFAHFIPGHSKTIGKSGTSYIDDFEAATTTIDLKTTPIRDWFLASVPQYNELFPEGKISWHSLETGFNRAKLAWYIVDPLFYSTDRNLPENVTKAELSRHSVRQVLQSEVFPNLELAAGELTNLPILNMAFYPSDIGPYNYDVRGSAYSSGLTEDGNGKLKDPETRWGGLMRRIETSDFEQANVEYIELWMMDPFRENEGHRGGDVLFHLGEISEDILRDSRKSFEHGLPENELVVDVDTTVWGRIPIKQALVDNFSNNPEARPYQDVGYDGLRDEDERTFFNTPNNKPTLFHGYNGYNYLRQIDSMFGGGSPAYIEAYDDPSHDNFHYFRGGGYDQGEQYASILEKYKKFNGPDGNSSVDQPDGYMIQSTTLPNKEDIDGDNTLNEDERYYEYKISLRPQDMRVVGENYITDIYKANIKLANGNKSDVNWYQFKIPISSPDNVVGNINDFRSIRFMRVIFRGFEEEVVCRFAKFQLVRADWRRYQYALLEASDYQPIDDEAATQLSIATINIEENSYRYPIPYVLPPGIDREINYATFQQTRRNEQSMVLKVTDLIDGDARAVYKNTNFDFTQFKYLKMFVHAEDLDRTNPNNYGDLTLFIRMGADITSNYYEYEAPLTITPWESKNEYDIWPEENNINIDLEKLVNYKLDRNNAYDLRQGEGSVPATVPYVIYDGDQKITIRGTPSISDVKAIMIGIRNPKASENPRRDDGRNRSAEIWVNELRLTDFINKQGWAATGRVRIDLADFGNIQFTALHTSAGFGSIEEKANVRSRDNITLLDFGTNLELGKMTPEKWGVRLPMHFDYSHNQAVPLYSPFDPDVKHKSVIRSFKDERAKKDYQESSVDIINRMNLNFINVRKERTDLMRDPHFWDFENFDFSYAFYLMRSHNVDVKFDDLTRHVGGFGYNYSMRPKEVAPFQNISFLRSPWLKLIRDFNFYYAPTSFSFRTNLEREFQEKLMRNKNIGADIKIPTSYYKNFIWNRDYNLRWNFTRGLRFQYQAQVNTFIDELGGGLGKDAWGTRAEKKKQIRDQFWKEQGTYDRFNQTVSLSYQVPLDKLPLTDWITLNADYTGMYNWIANSLALRNSLGNTIENNMQISFNGRVSLTNLYNKIGYLKELNSGRSQVRTTTPNRPGTTQNEQDSTSSRREGPSVMKKIADGFLKVLMMVKDVSGNYSFSDGTLLPGFLPDPGFFGINNGSTFGGAPGWGFVFGIQEKDDNFIKRAAEEGWITMDSRFNNPYSLKHIENMRFQATVEPFRDFRIDVSMNRQYSEMTTAFMKVDDNGVFPRSGLSQNVTGSFNMSTLLIATAFKKTDSESPFNSSLYEEMKKNREIISARLAEQNRNWAYDPALDTTDNKYKNGYGGTSQDVLLYSFLAAYQGKNASKIDISQPFTKFPLPNWRLNWRGLNNIDFIKEHFRSVALNHVYQSTYTISGFQSNILYKADEMHHDPIARDQIGDYIPKLSLGQVILSEQFIPFLGIDLTLKNSLMLRIEYKKTRSLTLSFVNNQLTEQSSNEISFGTGYRVSNLPNIFKTSGRTRPETTELNLRLDIGIRTNKTILRRLDSDLDEMSQGGRNITFNFKADYRISRTVTAGLYCDYNQTNPFTALQYKTSVTNAGISIRLNLAQ
jgi:cell surface protein SprA